MTCCVRRPPIAQLIELALLVLLLLVTLLQILISVPRPLLRGLASGAIAIPILYAAACAIDPRQGYVLATALTPSVLGTCLLLELRLYDRQHPPLPVAIASVRS